MKNTKRIKGFIVTIENIAGSIRKGIDTDGKEWSCEIKNPYGYFKNTVGADGDEVDVFIGPDVESNFNVYVINQIDSKTRVFDEHKVMFGFKSKEDAIKAYHDNYEDNWKGFENIITLTLSKFKQWLNNKEATKIPIKQEPMVSLDSDRLKVVELYGEVVDGETLADLQKQAGDTDDFDTLVVKIASPGGSVAEGLEIMVWLDLLSQQGKQVVTCVVANSYSIASLIMLAADMRLISKHGEVMVHNPMVPQLEYANANDLQEYVNSLRDLEGMMYELYQVFTGLEKETIKQLMDNETYLSPADAVKHGFADTVIDIKPRSFEMTANFKMDNNMSKTLNLLNRVIARVNKSEIVNQLYYTEAGEEVEIYQADPSIYKIGDKVSIDSGEIQLSDGSKLIVKEGTIQDIIKDVEEIIPDEEVAEEHSETPEPVVTPDSKPEGEEVLAGDFNTGPAPAEPVVAPAKEKDAMPASVIETTQSVTTKETLAEVPAPVQPQMPATPVEAKVEEMEAKAEVEEVEAKAEVEEVVEAKAEEMEAKYSEEMFKAFQAMMAKLEEKIDAKFVDIDTKLSNSSRFEEIASQAIDAISTGTTSNFTPEARAAAGEFKAKRSLFQTMKAKRGLK